MKLTYTVTVLLNKQSPLFEFTAPFRYVKLVNDEISHTNITILHLVLINTA